MSIFSLQSVSERLGRYKHFFLQRVVFPVNYFSAGPSFVDNAVFSIVFESVASL